MTRTFCTLFDVNYALRGLVLYRSLHAACPGGMTLWIFCMDRAGYEVLRRLDLESVVLVPLEELESADRALAEVKPSRTQIEYCWTATPSICAHVLKHDQEATAVTYLDADLMFFADPEPLFAEMGAASVAITPHRYSAQWKHWEEPGGIYNVQWVTFRRTAEGLRVLDWWRERCLEWCYARQEPGRFGDQKYLDDWPERFEGVHVLQHVGAGVALWNSSQYRLWRAPDGTAMADEVPIIFYHCHGLELYTDAVSLTLCGLASALGRAGLFDNSYHGLVRRPEALGWRADPLSPRDPCSVIGYRVESEEYELVWARYAAAISQELRRVRAVEPAFDAGMRRLPIREVVFWALRDSTPPSVRRRFSALRPLFLRHERP